MCSPSAYVHLGEKDDRTLRLCSFNNRSKGHGLTWRSVNQETSDLGQL